MVLSMEGEGRGREEGGREGREGEGRRGFAIGTAEKASSQRCLLGAHGASGAGLPFMSSKQSDFLLVLETQRSVPKPQQRGLSGKAEVLGSVFLSHW